MRCHCSGVKNFSVRCSLQPALRRDLTALVESHVCFRHPQKCPVDAARRACGSTPRPQHTMHGHEKSSQHNSTRLKLCRRATACKDAHVPTISNARNSQGKRLCCSQRRGAKETKSLPPPIVDARMAPEKVTRYASARKGAPSHHRPECGRSTWRVELLAISSGGRPRTRTVRHAVRIATTQDTLRAARGLQR